MLLRTFPIRTCSDSKLLTHQRLGRPCLLFHIEKCSGPCVGEIDKEAYDRLVEELLGFLDGDTEATVRAADVRHARGRGEPRVRAGGSAARSPDQRHARRSSASRWWPNAARISIWSASPTTISRRRSRSSTCAAGRVVGRKGFVVDKVEDLTPEGLVARILEGLYGDEPALGVPEAGARPRTFPSSSTCTRSGSR